MEDQDNPASQTLIVLTADIVAAHLSKNPVAIEEVATLIANTYGALAGLGQSAPAVEAPRSPAVSIRSSVKPDHVVCLECGRKMKMLKRHLATDHELSVEEYRQRWNLAKDHPLVAPNYAERRRELAKTIGLGRSPTQKRGRRKRVSS